MVPGLFKPLEFSCTCFGHIDQALYDFFLCLVGDCKFKSYACRLKKYLFGLNTINIAYTCIFIYDIALFLKKFVNFHEDGLK